MNSFHDVSLMGGSGTKHLGTYPPTTSKTHRITQRGGPVAVVLVNICNAEGLGCDARANSFLGFWCIPIRKLKAGYTGKYRIKSVVAQAESGCKAQAVLRLLFGHIRSETANW